MSPLAFQTRLFTNWRGEWAAMLGKSPSGFGTKAYGACGRTRHFKTLRNATAGTAKRLYGDQAASDVAAAW